MAIWYFGIVGIIVAILLIWLLARPHYKAEAFKRVTGQSVSYWDAMWLDLRVQALPSPSPTPRSEASR